MIALAFSSYLGILAERPAALSIAVLGSATLATFVHHSVQRERPTAAVLLAAMTGGLALLPVATSLAPGAPVVHGELHRGERLSIPAGVHGPLRVVVHADLPPASHQPVDYTLDGLAEPLTGHFERARAEGAGSNVHDTDVRTVEVEGASDLVVRSLRGPDRPALEVTVFRERWPLRHELGLALLALVGSAVISLRNRRATALFPVVVAATFFGMLVVRWLTPVAPLGQEIAAIAVASVVGAACYAPWRWLIERRRARASTT